MSYMVSHGFPRWWTNNLPAVVLMITIHVRAYQSAGTWGVELKRGKTLTRAIKVVEGTNLFFIQVRAQLWGTLPLHSYLL